MMAAMLGVAENVRVAPLHLVGYPGQDVREREQAGFLGHSRMEHDLQLQVAKFVRERVHVLARDRVGDFVGFLDGVGRDRLERLHGVPFATPHRIAQPAHDLDEAFKGHEGPLAR